MKLLLTFLLLTIIISYNATAQVKSIAPLSCFTWGPDRFLDYHTVERLAASQPKGLRSGHLCMSEYNYEFFGKDRGAYSWLPDVKTYSYINNVQVIRWNIMDNSVPYKISVTNIFDEELYSISTETSCGIIIFPDSVEATNKHFFIRIRPVDPRRQLSVINFDSANMKARDKQERLGILKDLQTCSTLECKIEKLKAQNATLDILSLLELEKMRDPSNKAVDKLYWEFVSLIRYEFCSTTWER